MDTEPEGEMATCIRAVDPEPVWIFDHRLIAIARDIPHDDLVAFFDLLAAELDVFQRCSTHMPERCLVTDYLGHHVRDQSWVSLELGELIGIAIELNHTRADRIARGVIPADDQQDQIAEEFLRVVDHVRSLWIVRQQGNEIEFFRLGGAFLPEPREIGVAFLQRAHAGFHIHFDADRFRCGCNIRPIGQEVAVFEWKIEQCGQHLRGQFF
mmetsp:Transcript_13693/g.17722  ORF Transcript_13693/g.17722 Transcript_13693/m.17722 type:complete len:211 (-) Transcript_13693:490-1122(-)